MSTATAVTLPVLRVIIMLAAILCIKLYSMPKDLTTLMMVAGAAFLSLTALRITEMRSLTERPGATRQAVAIIATVICVAASLYLLSVMPEPPNAGRLEIIPLAMAFCTCLGLLGFNSELPLLRLLWEMMCQSTVAGLMVACGIQVLDAHASHGALVIGAQIVLTIVLFITFLLSQPARPTRRARAAT